MSCISRQEIERFVLNYKKEKTLTTKTVALQCSDLCATMSQRVMYEWKTIESGLVRWRKVWILASEFEKMYILKFDVHNMSSFFVRVNCLLTVFSIVQSWMSCLLRGLLGESPADLLVSKWKILITNKQSVKQLLQRRLLHDHLLKLNTENSVWTHFILIEIMS